MHGWNTSEWVEHGTHTHHHPSVLQQSFSLRRSTKWPWLHVAPRWHLTDDITDPSCLSYTPTVWWPGWVKKQEEMIYSQSQNTPTSARVERRAAISMRYLYFSVIMFNLNRDEVHTAVLNNKCCQRERALTLEIVCRLLVNTNMWKSSGWNTHQPLVQGVRNEWKSSLMCAACTSAGIKEEEQRCVNDFSSDYTEQWWFGGQ